MKDSLLSGGATGHANSALRSGAKSPACPGETDRSPVCPPAQFDLQLKPCGQSTADAEIKGRLGSQEQKMCVLSCV